MRKSSRVYGKPLRPEYRHSAKAAPIGAAFVFVTGTNILQGVVCSHFGGSVMEQEVSDQEKTGYRLVLSKLATLPTQYLTLVAKVMTMLIARGLVLAPLLEKALAESIPKQSVLSAPSSDIEGEYEVPELPGGPIDLRNLPGMAADPDYEKWGLANLVAEPSPRTRVSITKADDRMILNRLISPSDPVENYLTQAQVEYLVLSHGDKIGKITRGGVMFFFYLPSEDRMTYEYFSFKVLGLNIPGRFRFAVRRASDPKNDAVPLQGAYLVRVKEVGHD